MLEMEQLSAVYVPALSLLLVVLVVLLYVRRKRSLQNEMPCPIYQRIVQHQPTENATQVLIAGGAGFLGRHIVKQLIERKGCDVHVFDIELPLEDLRDPLVASYIKGDIRQMSHVQEALTGIDTVFHTAGVFSHNVNVTDKLMWDVNVTGTETIVKVCQEKSIRKLIFTSTCIVTMGKDDAIAEGWDEKHPYPREPVNGYVKSKIAAEAIVLAANSVTPSGEGLATCVMRPGGMFGIGDNMLADMALQGRDNYYIGDGTARFDLVHVNAVAYGHICAANHLSPVNDKIPIAAGKVYNLTAGKPVMYKEFFGGLCDGPKSFWGHAKPKSIPVWLASALATINEVTYRSLGIILFAKSFTRLSVEMTQRSYWFNNERAMQDLGYTPLLKWRDHIDLLVQDYSFSCSTAPRLRRRSVPCLSSPHISSRGSIADHRGAT